MKSPRMRRIDRVGYQHSATFPLTRSCTYVSVLTPVLPVLAPLPDTTFFFGILPMFHPQDLSVFTTFGKTAAVSGTLRNMNDL
jgi:hypothetical protein